MLAVYSDSGLLAEGTHIPNILTWSQNTGSPAVLAEQSGGGAPGDTLKYQSFTSNGDNYMGWGITLDKNVATYKRDMNVYASGHIKFYLKTSRALAGAERVFINVEEAGGPPGAKSPNVIIGPTYGWASATSTWQEVSVPVSAITGIALANVRLPIEITMDNIGSSITMDVDFVRWTTD